MRGPRLFFVSGSRLRSSDGYHLYLLEERRLAIGTVVTESPSPSVDGTLLEA